VSKYNELADLIFILTVLIALFLNDIAHEIIVDNLVLLLISGFIIAVLSKIFPVLIKSIMYGNKNVRKKLLGKEYLEGKWIDEVRCNNEVIGYGLITVSSNLDSIRIDGEWYDTALNQKLDNFHSEHLQMEWPVITFVHQAHRGDKKEKPSIKGITVITIQVNIDSAPNQWIGYYVDELDSCYNNTVAYKILDRSIIKKLENTNTKKDAIKELIGKNFNKPLTVIAK